MTACYIRSLATALAAIGVVAARGAAQSSARFGLAAGATAPVSSYASGKNVGYHVGLLIDVRVPVPGLGFRVDGAFHELGFSGNSTKDDIWLANGNVMFKAPTGMVKPYLIGGAGFYNSHRTLLLRAQSSTTLGVNVGGGVRFELPDITAFVEARYHRAGGDGGIRI